MNLYDFLDHLRASGLKPLILDEEGLFIYSARPGYPETGEVQA